MAKAIVTHKRRTTVQCGNKVSDIYEALGRVSNGARLTCASFSPLDVTLVFDYEEEVGDDDGPCR